MELAIPVFKAFLLGAVAIPVVGVVLLLSCAILATVLYVILFFIMKLTLIITKQYSQNVLVKVI